MQTQTTSNRFVSRHIKTDGFAPLYTPAVSAGPRSHLHDSRYAQLAQVRDLSWMYAMAAHSVRSLSDAGLPPALAEYDDALGFDDAADDEDLPARILRNIEPRRVRMVMQNDRGQFWLQHETIRQKVTEIEVMGQDYLDDEDLGPIVPVNVRPSSMPSTHSVPKALRTYVVRGDVPRDTRRCSDCNKLFVVPRNAPGADKCHEHHQKRVADRQRRLEGDQPLHTAVRKTHSVPRKTPRQQAEDILKGTIREGRKLPEGARFTGSSSASQPQVTIAYNGESFTIYRSRLVSLESWHRFFQVNYHFV